jgi:hypothetical protein
MSRTDRRPRPSLAPALAMLLAVAPACSATAGHHRQKAQEPVAAPSGRVAYRPIYSRLLQPKTVYLNTYAANPYPPVLNPTAFRARAGQPRAPFFAWPGAHP